MLLVYVAGPFRGPHAWAIAENIRAAERVGLEIANAGAMPVIPHANTAHFHGIGDDSFWLEGTLEIMRACHIVVMTPEWERSSGARAERAEAEAIGMPVHVFSTPAELGAWIKIQGNDRSLVSTVSRTVRDIAKAMRTAKQRNSVARTHAEGARVFTVTVDGPVEVRGPALTPADLERL